MRIVSWNIRAGGGRRAEQIAEQLERWRPHVAVLSEFRATEPSRWLADALGQLGLTHQRSTAEADNQAANRLLVASRWQLRTVRLRRAPSEPGRWLLVRVAAPQTFSLGAMHAPNRVTGRKYPYLDAVLSIASGWRGGPALFLGDTNSGRIGIDEEAPAFNKQEDAWVQSLEAAGWPDVFRHTHGEARAYTWYSPNGRNGFRLDQAFVNRSLLPRLLDARYEWGQDGSARRDCLSDHAALIVDLEP
jgi:exonuclease III